MPPFAVLRSRLWFVLPLLAAAYLGVVTFARVGRVQHVTGVVPAEAVVSATSPTGYVGGIRLLVVPEHGSESCRWIMQTQQMLAGEGLRVRQIEYENAPQGRTSYATSPYRWWLGAAAWVDHVVSGRPLGQAVEHAALWADPLLLGILFALTLTLTWRGFGAWPASLLALGLAGLFPWTAEFMPGLPDDKALARTCALLGVIALLAGMKTGRSVPRWFFVAGLLGSLGLWVNAAELMPLLAAIAVGAAVAIVVVRRETEIPAEADPRNWLAWSFGGAGGSLVFYFVEYAPEHLGGWRLQYLHLLHGVAWLGLGLLLWTLSGGCRRKDNGDARRLWLPGLSGALALLALPLAWWWQSGGDGAAPADAAWTFRLTRLAGGAEGASLWEVFHRDGASAQMMAALLPMTLLGPALWLLLRKQTDARHRARLAVVTGMVVVMLGFAAAEIGRWSSLGIPLLALVTVVTEGVLALPGARARWLWVAAFALVLIPGIRVMHPSSGAPDREPLNESELSGLIARDLAHWLARRNGSAPVVVLASSELSTALAYYGGLHVLGSADPENIEALGATAKIFSATTPQEALARIQKRSVGFIVMPSWDRALDEYVRLNGAQAADAFLAGLRNWAPLPWLKPVAYPLPGVPGYEGQSVAVFETVEEQDEVDVLAAQAEYFAEMGRLDFAAALSQALQRFPRQPAALVARGQVALARQDAAALAEVVQALGPLLTAGADRNLSWERRAGLAAVLLQGKQRAAAEAQVRRCLNEVTERRLRSCPTLTLYRLLVLAKTFGLQINDPVQRELARSLIPAEWRSRL